MEKILGNFLEKPAVSGFLYAVFRVVVGFLFLSHGLQKIFGAFGGVDGAGGAVGSVFGLFGAAGVIEVFVGLAVLTGVFVRPFAVLGAAEMLVAYFLVHSPNGMHPILNGGELSLLFMASFLVMAVEGAGFLSLEKSLFGKELF